MPVAPIPPPFEYLGGRRFAFQPPIFPVETNEWTFRRASWSEILVRNAITGSDLWIPRRFVGEAADLSRLVVVVKLSEALELREGMVLPRRRRVIVMPAPASNSVHPPKENASPAPVVGIRLEQRTESRASRVVGGAVALGVLGCLALVGYSWQGESHRRAVFSSLDKTYLALTSADNAKSVVDALGVPDSDRWMLSPPGVRLRLLSYADRGFSAVLMPDSAGEHYIGAVDQDGRTLQSVLLPDGSTSARFLKGLDQ